MGYSKSKNEKMRNGIWLLMVTLQASIYGVFDSLLAFLNLLPVESVNYSWFVSTFHANFGTVML